MSASWALRPNAVVTPLHISTPVPWSIDPRLSMAEVQSDGICHCSPQPTSSPFGECPSCHRLDGRKSAVEFVAGPPVASLVGAVAPPARAVMSSAGIDTALQPQPTQIR